MMILRVGPAPLLPTTFFVESENVQRYLYGMHYQWVANKLTQRMLMSAPSTLSDGSAEGV
jgi:hypothetical protein